MKRFMTDLSFTALIVAGLFVFLAANQSSSIPISADADKEVISLWPTGNPDGSTVLSESAIKALKAKEKKRPGRLAYVESASLTVFPAPVEKATGTAVVICPGGGYSILSWSKEGLEIAEWFNSVGVTAFVLKYRVPRRLAPEKIHWEPMQDVQRAIRVIRHEAAGANKYGIDPNRIGVLGFSAGGHLSVMAGVQYNTKCYEAKDDADKVSARPNFMCPIYVAYLGDNYDDKKAKLGSLVTVTKETPPTFMAVTTDDAMRGAQSALLYVRLKEHGVPVELHAYSQGGHGYGMRPSRNPVSKWGDRLEDWLRISGFLDR